MVRPSTTARGSLDIAPTPRIFRQLGMYNATNEITTITRLHCSHALCWRIRSSMVTAKGLLPKRDNYAMAITKPAGGAGWKGQQAPKSWTDFLQIAENRAPIGRNPSISHGIVLAVSRT